MKHCIILVLLHISSYGQVIFNKIPLDRQLIGRNLDTNLGHIIVEGEVKNLSVNYDSLLIELYKNDALISSLNSSLNYISGVSTFNFDIPITAELSNYSIKIYGKLGTTLTIEKVVQDIVAGDVFIIQGQSNAEAKLYNGSANDNQNNFIRVYTNGTYHLSRIINNDEWFLGQGDSDSNGNGNTGQWGLKLAKSIVEFTNVPIAIFNGAHSGREISFFQPPNDYKTSLKSNYGRLYHRLNKTGLSNYVRAIFWSQGETDGYTSTSTIEYKSEFIELKNSWIEDYPNIEKFYIFQTKSGCGRRLMEVKEAQRQLAYENKEISIMSTSAITQHTDDCHFPFKNGYEIFADRIFPLVQRDLYSLNISYEIDPPMITNAYLSNDTTLILETDATNLLKESFVEDFELSNAGSSKITNIITSQNKIIFTLSENPGFNPEISYLAQSSSIENFITNNNNLELISFYRYPINTSTLSNIEIIKNYITVYPNPTNDLLNLRLSIYQQNLKIRLLDTLGREVYVKLVKEKYMQIKLPNKKGFYFLVVEGEQKYLIKVLKI